MVKSTRMGKTLYAAMSRTDKKARKHGLFKYGCTTRPVADRLGEICGNGSTETFEPVFQLPLPPGVSDQAVLNHPLIRRNRLARSARNEGLRTKYRTIWGGPSHVTGLDRRRELVLAGQGYDMSMIKKNVRTAIRETHAVLLDPDQFKCNDAVKTTQVSKGTQWIVRPSANVKGDPFWVCHVTGTKDGNVYIRYLTPVSTDDDPYEGEYKILPGGSTSCLPGGKGLMMPVRMKRVRKGVYRFYQRSLSHIRCTMIADGR